MLTTLLITYYSHRLHSSQVKQKRGCALPLQAHISDNFCTVVMCVAEILEYQGNLLVRPMLTPCIFMQNS